MKTNQYPSKKLLNRIYLFFSHLFADQKNSISKNTSPAHVYTQRSQYRPESHYLANTVNGHKNKYPGTYAFSHRYR